MCPIASTGADAGHDFMAEKRRKRQAILDNNLINIWQKKHLLDALDKEYAKYETAAPAQPVVPVAKTNAGNPPQANLGKKKAPTPTPSPTKGPVAGPAPTPTPTPPPEPKKDTTKPAPRPVQARKPFYTDDTIEAYKPPVAAPATPKPVQTGSYEAARKALDATFMPKQSQIKLGRELDEQYGTNEKAAQNQKIIDDNRAKLQAQTDEINRIKERLRDLRRYRYEDSGGREADALAKQLDEKIRGFGNVAGLSGGVIDPTRVVDIKLDGKNVGNARYVDGKATGDLDDVVKGLGGDVVWDKLKSGATIYDPDENIVSYLTKAGNKIIEKDTKGNIIKRYSTEGGNAQADIEGFAGRFDVPYNYYHDKNGVYRAYSQPEMRGAPITVVRKEGDVYIEANVEFVGNADDIFPNTNNTYAEVAYQGILDNWNTTSPYNVSGQDANGNFLANDAVNVHLNLYGVNGDKNGVMKKPLKNNPKTVKIDISNDFFRSLPNKLGISSHVFTENPLDAILNPVTLVNISKNLGEAIVTGQKEKALYNWSIQKPGMMTLYSDNSQIGYGETAAHEFGHLLGLGDAYGASYRDHKSSPLQYDDVNDYGQMAMYHVPANDMMRSNEMVWNQATLTDNDVRLLANAWKTGNAQYYKK